MPPRLTLLLVGPEEGVTWVREELGALFDVRWVPGDAGAVDAALPEVDVVLDASMRVRFDVQRLGRSPSLRLFMTSTTGTDHVDTAALAQRRVPFHSLATERDLLSRVTATAELSFLLLLACARHLRAAMHDVEQGNWDRTKFPGWTMRGRVLGVVGCGRIGQWVAGYARAMEMRVVGYDPCLHTWPEGIERTSFEALLKISDAVTLHVPLSDRTRHMMDSAAFGRMRQGAILINTSRGAIVSESALLDALRNGVVASYGADVVEGEPDVCGTALWQYARHHNEVILTPHIGGFSPEALELVLRHSARRVREFFLAEG